MPDNLSQDDSDMTPGLGVGWVIVQGVLIVMFLLSVIWAEPVEDVPGLVFARIVGVIVAIAGAAISVWAAVFHGSRLTPFPKPVDGMQVIDQGPYRYVRHPMYSGIIAFTLGVGLAYANPATMLSSLTFFVFFMAKTGHEEDLLVQLVPGYRRYRSLVPWRLIPYLV